MEHSNSVFPSDRARSLAVNVVAASVGVAFVVLGIGLWQSGVVAQRLWSRILAEQAACVLAFAGVATAIGVWAVPLPRLRGWPSLAGITVLGCTIVCGVGATLAAALIVAT